MEKEFSASLSKMSSKVVDHGEVYTILTLTTPKLDDPNLAENFDSDLEVYETKFKAINFDIVSKKYTLNFDGHEFEVYLDNVKLSKKEVKHEYFYVYNLEFRKDIDEYDKWLAESYLKRKEYDENDKLKTVFYDASLER